MEKFQITSWLNRKFGLSFLYILILMFVNIDISYAAVSKDRLKKIIDRFETMYDDVFKDKGYSLKIKYKGLSKIDNASATIGLFNSDKKIVELYGGDVKHSVTTERSIVATLCHEIGHHLADGPRTTEIGLYRVFSGAVEGEADYWAARYCLPKYFKKYHSDHSDIFNVADDKAYKLCADTSKDLDQCLNVIWASYAMVHDSIYLAKVLKYKKIQKESHHGVIPQSLFAELSEAEPSLDSLDPTETDHTISLHPPFQCRLDTMVTGYLHQKRARCWYKD